MLDLSGEPDPLARLVMAEPAHLLARRLDHPALAWRAASELRRQLSRPVVAWGERVFAVAAQAGAMTGFYRPSESPRRLPPPVPGWRALAASGPQAKRLRAAGWAAAEVSLLAPPGEPIGEESAPTRRSLEVDDADFVWLLAGESSGGAGLREAIWAATILHVVERGQRRHRLLLSGDSPGHRRAKTFLDQLGLPELHITTTRWSYPSLTAVADAMLLLPHAGGGAWSASVAAWSGLPAVINRRPTVMEVLGDRPNVRIAPGDEPRMVVREMLRLAEVPASRAGTDNAFSSGQILERWQAIVRGRAIAASG